METGIFRASQERLGYGAGPKNGVIVVTLTIPTEVYRECKEKGWKYKEVFLSGMENKRGMPQMSQRIYELEEGNKKLQQKLSQFWQQMAAMTPKGEE